MVPESQVIMLRNRDGGEQLYSKTIYTSNFKTFYFNIYNANLNCFAKSKTIYNPGLGIEGSFEFMGN